MKGSCNCNTVSFEILNEVEGLYQCHCKLCQKQSGSTSNTATIVKGDDFTWLTGENSISHWRKDSGFTSHFCKQCGCPVPNRLRSTNFYWIPMGLVDDFDINVTTHLFCASKASWDLISDTASRFDGMPADIDAFFASFQK
jgi:hypothetical protein